MSRIGEKFNRWRTRRKMEKQGLVGSRRRRIEDSELLLAADRSRILGTVLLVLLWGVCALLLSLPVNVNPETRLVTGQPAPRTVFADFEFSYEDRKATAANCDAAVKAEPIYYSMSAASDDLLHGRFEKLFSAVRLRIEDEQNKRKFIGEPGSVGESVARLDSKTLDILGALLGNDAAMLEFNRELDNLLNAGILSTSGMASSRVDQKIRIVNRLGHERTPEVVTALFDPNSAAKRLADSMLRFYPKEDDRDTVCTALTALCKDALGDGGNLTYDEVRTKNGQELAKKAVPPVTHIVPKKQPIVTSGQIVDASILDKLDAYEKYGRTQENSKNDYLLLLQNVVWSLVLVLFVGFYMYHIHPDVVNSNRKIALFSFIIIVSLLLDYSAMTVFSFVSRTTQLPADLVIDAVPLALASVLLAVTSGFRLALYAGFLVSSICGMLLGRSFDFALEAMVLCALGALVVRGSTNYREFFLRIMFLVALGSWLMNVNILNYFYATPKAIAESAVVSLCNGIFTATAALLMIFLMELVFHVDTSMSLMVLCDYNHPLLERMKREAPGTFFHSLMVATLSEDAARAIHANPIKAKTGALFHDIGKLSKPQYFTENNLERDNQHIDLNPQVSSIIIRDHVKEGLDLARQYKLSRVVRDAIEQHHGNDLVHYFYQRALEDSRNSGIPITEAQYRYQGQPPRDREMAIISLADACEAACRSLEKPSAAKVEALVDEIFRKRFRDGQLARANLTLAELKLVRDSFVNNLVSMRHGRVAYQKEDNNDENDLFLAKPQVPVAAARTAESPRQPER